MRTHRIFGGREIGNGSKDYDIYKDRDYIDSGRELDLRVQAYIADLKRLKSGAKSLYSEDLARGMEGAEAIYNFIDRLDRFYEVLKNEDYAYSEEYYRKPRNYYYSWRAFQASYNSLLRLDDIYLENGWENLEKALEESSYKRDYLKANIERLREDYEYLTNIRYITKNIEDKLKVLEIQRLDRDKGLDNILEAIDEINYCLDAIRKEEDPEEIGAIVDDVLTKLEGLNHKYDYLKNLYGWDAYERRVLDEILESKLEAIGAIKDMDLEAAGEEPGIKNLADLKLGQELKDLGQLVDSQGQAYRMDYYSSIYGGFNHGSKDMIKYRTEDGKNLTQVLGYGEIKGIYTNDNEILGKYGLARGQDIRGLDLEREDNNYILQEAGEKVYLCTDGQELIGCLITGEDTNPKRMLPNSEEATIDRLNSYRLNRGLDSLDYSYELSILSLNHIEDIYYNDIIEDYEAMSTKSLEEKAGNYDYTGRLETKIIRHPSRAFALYDSFFEDEEFRSALLDPDLTKVGLAVSSTGFNLEKNGGHRQDHNKKDILLMAIILN